MTFLQSLILGIIQGLTEFLPVSSSAHLVLLPHLLGWQIPEEQIFPFDVFIQVGTLIAVIIYFWKDILQVIKAFISGLVQKKPFEDPDARLGWYLILATLPIGFIGLLIKPIIERTFSRPILSGWFLLGTAVLLIAAEFFSRQTRKEDDMKWQDALWIGFFQVLALLPGISRSGATISGGMTRHLERPAAARFAFLLSIPAMLGAGIFSLPDLIEVSNLANFLPVLVVGFIAALLVGYLAIHWLLGLVRKHSLVYFAAYCAIVGLAVILFASKPLSTTAASIPTTTQQGSSHAAPLISPASTIEFITVEYGPSLEWLVPVMASCADVQEGVSILTSIVPGTTSEPANSDLLLRWGEPDTLNLSTAVIGTDRLVIITHPQNPLESLTLEAARKLFGGQVETWKDLYSTCPDCFSSKPDETWLNRKPALHFYTSGTESQDLLVSAVLNGAPVPLSAGIITPSTKQMVEAVSQTEDAVGFIPQGGVTDAVKAVTISDVDTSSLQYPILVIYETKPEGITSQWLGCLQLVLNP